MRLVQVMVPAGKRDDVVRLLDGEDLDYVVTDETSGREFDAVVYFPLPTAAVEPVLDGLRDAGLEESAYTVVIDAETVISRRFEELEEKYAEGEEEDSDRIAREELTARAREMSPGLPTFVVMTVISGVIATAGLLLDSPAVVVGSMVIAPLVGPAMAAAVGTVVSDQELFARGVKLQVLGLVLAVVSATAFAFLVRTLHFVPPGLDISTVPEIRERLLPDFLSLAVALGAGIAGVVSLSSGVSTALVGVMIAVALIPPAAAVGIALAWGLPSLSLGAGILALVNGLSINLAALATLWYRGYRPGQWFHLSEARSATITRITVLVAAIAVLSLFLGGVTYTSFQSAQFEETVRNEAAAAVDQPAYEELSLLDVEVEFGDQIVFRSPRQVVVTVGRPAGSQYPAFAEALRERITEATGRRVAVEVRFVDVERTGSVPRRQARAPDTPRDATGLAGGPGEAPTAPAAVVAQGSSKGSSGSYPTASTAASSAASTPLPSVTLM